MKVLNLKTKLVITALMSLLFVGCSKDDDGTNPAPPFTFLKVGNEWVYEECYYPYGYFDTFKLKIIAKNKNYFKVIKNDDTNNYEYWYYDGKHLKINIKEIGDEGSIFIYRNCFVGQKWDFNDSIYAEVVGSLSRSLVVEMKVPAGTFSNCIRVSIYHHNYRLWHRNIYFDRKVGIVFEERGGDYMDYVVIPHQIQLISKNF
jgi:hypothetical protein